MGKMMFGAIRRHGLEGAVVGISVALRAGCGILATFLLGLALSKAQAAAIFQLLFLQGAFIAFISASGYARSVSQSEAGLDARANFAAYSWFVGISSVFASMVAVAFLPPNYLGAGTSSGTWIVALLIGSGALAALGAVLQGSLVLEIGKVRIFGLASIGSALGLGIIIASAFRPSAASIAGALAASQALLFVSLIVFVKRARAIVGGSLRFVHPGGKMFSGGIGSISSIGAVNALSLLSFFAVREHWRGIVADDVAANVFFFVRITDLCLQFVYVFFASSPYLIRVLLSKLKDFRGVFAVCVPFGLAWTIILNLSMRDTSPSVSELILAEIVLFLPRLSSAFFILKYLQNPGHKQYCYAIYFSIAALAGTYFLFENNSYAMHAVALSMSTAIVIIGFWQERSRL